MQTQFKITTILLFFGLSAISAPQVFSSAAAEEADVFAGKQFIFEDYLDDEFSQHIPQWSKYKPNFQGRPDIRGLQFGIGDGRSIIWTAENYFNGPRSTIDVFEHGELEKFYENFLSNFNREIAKGQVIPTRSPNRQALLELNLDILKHARKPYDFIYLDGMDELHDYKGPDIAVESVLLTWKLLKDGGILIIDSYREFEESNGPCTVKYAIDEFMKLCDGKYEVLHNGYQMHIQKHALKKPAKADASASASAYVVEDYV